MLGFVHLAQSDAGPPKPLAISWVGKQVEGGKKGSRNISHVASPKTDLLSSFNHKNSLRKSVSQRSTRVDFVSTAQRASGVLYFSVCTSAAFLPEEIHQHEETWAVA